MWKDNLGGLEGHPGGLEGHPGGVEAPLESCRVIHLSRGILLRFYPFMKYLYYEKECFFEQLIP